MNKSMERNAMWIWDKSMYSSDTKLFQQELVYFRRVFRATPGNVFKVKVSADSRYRLFINGVSVAVGPCKGDGWHTHYETIDLSAYIREGVNVLAAVVLHLPKLQPFVFGLGGAVSIPRSSSGGFLLQGILMDGDQAIENLSSGRIWSCLRATSVEFIPGAYGIPATCFEHIYGAKTEQGWNRIDYDASCWSEAFEIEEALFPPNESHPYGIYSSWRLAERPIPPTYEQEKDFVRIIKSRKHIGGIALNNPLDIAEIKGLQVHPGSKLTIELDAGELMTAFFHMQTLGGAGGLIKVTYTECYEELINDIVSNDKPANGMLNNDKFIKGIRDNSNGELRGDYDIFEPAKGEIEFEPFWYRTFRYIRLDIETLDDELIIQNCCFRETGYPLNIIGAFHSSDEYSHKLWEISIRTLNRCMYETFMDCPYYEQLQYILDTRLQALFSYQISTDDRLVRKAIEDFRSSLTPEGLLQSRYPSMQIQIIPSFSLHWIYMLEDHWMYFGDQEMIKKCRPVIDSILDWYDRRIDETGLVGTTGFWPFIDWVKSWDMDSIPPAAKAGPVTIDTLMYIKALRCAALLNKATGRQGIAEEYLGKAKKAGESVKALCWDKEAGLFTDGPGFREYSQHAQVWAVLAGILDETMARELMMKVLKEDMSQMSYAATYFICRALELTELYNEAYESLWKPWKQMADLHLTTWVEDPVSQRSDCHGWGALPLYEFPAAVLGVKPGSAGYKTIRIKPYTCGLHQAKGTVATIHGSVDVEWHIKEHEFLIVVNGPDKIPMILQMPNGTILESLNGKIQSKCIV